MRTTTLRKGLVISLTTLAACSSENTITTEGLPELSTVETAMRVNATFTNGDEVLSDDEIILFSNRVMDDRQIEAFLRLQYAVWGWNGSDPCLTAYEETKSAADILDDVIGKGATIGLINPFHACSDDDTFISGEYSLNSPGWYFCPAEEGYRFDISLVMFKGNALKTLAEGFDVEACRAGAPWFTQATVDNAILERQIWVGEQGLLQSKVHRQRDAQVSLSDVQLLRLDGENDFLNQILVVGEEPETGDGVSSEELAADGEAMIDDGSADDDTLPVYAWINEANLYLSPMDLVTDLASPQVLD